MSADALSPRDLFALGDTATPIKAALIAAAFNIAFKFLLMGPRAQIRLALCDLDRPSDQSWPRDVVSVHARHDGIDECLGASLVKCAIAGLVLAAVLWLAVGPSALFANWHHLCDVVALALMVVIGAAAYLPLLLVLFGRQRFLVFGARS